MWTFNPLYAFVLDILITVAQLRRALKLPERRTRVRLGVRTASLSQATPHLLKLSQAGANPQRGAEAPLLNQTTERLLKAYQKGANPQKACQTPALNRTTRNLLKMSQEEADPQRACRTPRLNRTTQRMFKMSQERAIPEKACKTPALSRTTQRMLKMSQGKANPQKAPETPSPNRRTQRMLAMSGEEHKPTAGHDRILTLSLSKALVRPGESISAVLEVTPRATFTATEVRVLVSLLEETTFTAGGDGPRAPQPKLILSGQTHFTAGATQRFPFRFIPPGNPRPSLKTPRTWLVTATLSREDGPHYQVQQQVIVRSMSS